MSLFESAERLEALLTRLNYRYCIIGGVALQRWGAPRTTLDVDLTLLVEFGEERAAAQAILAELAPRIDDALAFSVRNRVLLVRDAAGTSIDVAFGAMPFEVRCVERATLYQAGASRIRTCSAEDLVVHKVFAGRPQDWIDVESVLTRTATLDWKQIEEELVPLLELKESPESWTRLLKVRQGLSSR
jgi:Nucleotidyltransferase of unknown function (DUF6036)